MPEPETTPGDHRQDEAKQQPPRREEQREERAQCAPTERMHRDLRADQGDAACRDQLREHRRERPEHHRRSTEHCQQHDTHADGQEADSVGPRTLPLLRDVTVGEHPAPRRDLKHRIRHNPAKDGRDRAPQEACPARGTRDAAQQRDDDDGQRRGRELGDKPRSPGTARRRYVQGDGATARHPARPSCRS
ncbi:hypothetical protein ACFPRL_28385 [Pseudoclavibacter helvolus]